MLEQFNNDVYAVYTVNVLLPRNTAFAVAAYYRHLL